MTASAPITILFAGGGSGGHIFPALAIAERLGEIEPEARCLFACSQRPLDVRILRGREVAPLAARPWSLRPARLAEFVGGWVRSRRAIERLIAARSVHHVVAMGGFVAAPAVAAAARRGVPCTLVNLDAVPGKANRWMARRCTRVLSAVPTAIDLGAEIAGMPIRRAAIAVGGPEACRTALGLDPGQPTLLVCGGSQGAATINRLMIALVGAAPAGLAGWQVLHIGGEGGERELEEAYARAGLRALVLAFTDRMGDAWGAADLALSRAGAGSVAEAAANGVPTLFLPYPFHRDQHQMHNAAPLEKIGGAVVDVDLVDEAANLAAAGRVLLELVQDAPRRAMMREALRRSGPADAALDIATGIVGDVERCRGAAATSRSG